LIYFEFVVPKVLGRPLYRWHIAATRYDALWSEMPWPFLGVSSLNLAAPSGAAFFLSSDAGVHEALRLTRKRVRRNDAPSAARQRIAL
jgi:hypothetical protein